jgi:hypothetical protein
MDWSDEAIDAILVVEDPTPAQRLKELRASIEKTVEAAGDNAARRAALALGEVRLRAHFARYGA